MNITLAEIVFSNFGTDMKCFNYWYDTNLGRKEILSATCVRFFVLTGALRSRQPLPPFIPDPHGPRSKLYSKFSILAKEFANMKEEDIDVLVLIKYFSYCFSAQRFMDSLIIASESVWTYFRCQLFN